MCSAISDALGDCDEYANANQSAGIVRSTSALEHHLNGEVLPHVDNYDSQHIVGGLRPTLEELHLGEASLSEKVSGSLSCCIRGSATLNFYQTYNKC